jgi:hypothetical protein
MIPILYGFYCHTGSNRDVFDGSTYSEHEQSYKAKFLSGILLTVSVLLQANSFLITEFVAGYIHDHLSDITVVVYSMDVSKYGNFVRRLVIFLNKNAF